MSQSTPSELPQDTPTASSSSGAAAGTAGGRESLQRAYRLGRCNNNVLTLELLQSEGFSRQAVLLIFQALVERRLAVVRKNAPSTSGGAAPTVWCRVREEGVAHKLQGIDSDTHKVYTCIEESGNKGIWTSDIRRATNLSTQNLNKCIKTLEEGKKLIKQVKNIHLKSRKFYMLIDLEPAVDVAGGSFYEDGEFNDALVDRIRDHISHCLLSGQSATLQEISQYVRTAGIGTELSDQDIGSVIGTLEFEQKVCRTIHPTTGAIVFTWERWTSSLQSISAFPCGTCPVYHNCYSGSERVSPECCTYISHWMGQGDETAATSKKLSTEYVS
eukprot:GHVS01090859.1.p1 GENE.GHVS01090859.1~~GHVS01090859.1.p1  ORF type:complete len:329 (+),score=16.02 GHVS01090859.1:50-1036(+)